MFRKRRTREIVCAKRHPVKRLAESREMRSPLDEGARLPQDVGESVRLTPENAPNLLRFIWRQQIEALRAKARACRLGIEKWRASLSDARRTVQGKRNLPLLAHMLNDLGMGVEKRAQQFGNGFATACCLAGPDVQMQN